ncbi:MAG TPA: biotin carboxylase N-terminal domain-containing protein, partial [Candidatus Limnocylindrales bacterium]|nr:biotin carboxylase N-terminal domain-containing protein [Candidatus Limnocylindrales bacterium]
MHTEPQPLGIRTLFVANRGEIARRIARTARRMGTAIVVPDVDGPGALDLLDVDAVVGAALAAEADAVHPGFGFLAESAPFAEAVIAAGLRWVGPPPEAIRAMGDKAAARRLATRLGIPVVPGYDGAGQSDRALKAAAGRIGYPLLVKPSGGGGGKGMRVVREPERLADALAGARREAAAAFGIDRLVLERLVEGGRHVEVQVLFDREGQGIHLGERDCSTQRRHQKVLEETPSPAVTPAIRDQLTDAALRLSAAVGYQSAGTCEFLLTDRDEVFFLEMNTRLQVEHPVTELVTGLDLVELQLRIAAGEALPLDQAAADAARTSGGHAVEVRLYAEDAEAGFLPATGRVERLAWPSRPDVRIDAGIDQG